MKVKYLGNDFPGSLTHGAVYLVVDQEAEQYFRIIDDSGEDYLYAKTRFVVVDPPL